MAATLLPPLGTAVLIGTTQQSSAWLRANDVLGLVVFVTAFAVCGGFVLLPTYTPALVGGWAFGLWTGWRRRWPDLPVRRRSGSRLPGECRAIG